MSVPVEGRAGVQRFMARRILLDKIEEKIRGHRAIVSDGSGQVREAHHFVTDHSSVFTIYRAHMRDLIAPKFLFDSLYLSWIR